MKRGRTNKTSDSNNVNEEMECEKYLLTIKVVTSLTKDELNPIFFCMGHGAHKSSWTGPIRALQMFSGPRYRAFSGKTLGG